MQQTTKVIPSAIFKIKTKAVHDRVPSWTVGKDHQSLTARLFRKGFRPVTHKHCAGQGCFLCQNVGIIWENPVTGHGAIVEYNEQGFLVDVVI